MNAYLRSFVGLLIVPAIACCAWFDITAQPDHVRKELQEGRSLLLFEVRHNPGQKVFEMRPGRSSLEMTQHMTIFAVNLDTGESFRSQDVWNVIVGHSDTFTTFDGPSDHRWAGLLLAPGVYFVKVFPPEGRTGKSSWDWRDNRFLVEVPQGAIVYGGSLTVNCTVGRMGMDCGSTVAVHRDTYLAEQAVAGWLDTPAQITTGKMKSLSDAPEIRHPPGRHNVEIREPEFLLPYPTWGRFDNTTDPGQDAYLESMAAVYERELFGVPQEAGAAGLGLLIMLAPAVPFIVAVDIADSSSEKSEWKDCFDQARESAAAFPFERIIREELTPKESAALTDAAVPERQVQYEFALSRIVLRRCGAPEEVCLEMALRVRHVEESGLLVDQRTYLYTSEQFRDVRMDKYSTRFVSLPAHPWWEEMIPASSPSRPMHEYCGDRGEDILRAELRLALKTLVDYFVHELTD